jgi:N-acetylglucosamine malate deacetylase 1
MASLRYLAGRALTLWKRSRLVADVLARRLLFRLLASPHLLSLNESLSAKPLSPKLTDKLVVLAPHSDDESIGCGGLLAKFATQASVVCLTNGAKGDPKMPRDLLIETREQELGSAMQLAGVKQVSFLGVEDQNLTEDHQRFFKLDLSEVDWIFLPNFLDQHPDHKAVTTQLQALLRARGYQPNLKVAFYEIWGALPVWNAYVELTPDLWQLKQTMIACFQSQIKQIDYASRIQGLHLYRGIAVGKGAVEAYLVLNVDDFLAIA